MPPPWLFSLILVHTLYKIVWKTPLGRVGMGWGDMCWKENINVLVLTSHLKVYSCCLFQTGNICSWEWGTSVGEKYHIYWIAIYFYLKVPWFDFIKQACLSGKWMRIRRTVWIQVSEEKETWSYAQIFQKFI